MRVRKSAVFTRIFGIPNRFTGWGVIVRSEVMTMSEQLTARQLVAELKRRGIGDWGTAVVRRWIHEEPACPIAQRGRPGQSHKYDADDVAAWLADRDRRTGYVGSGVSADAESADAAEAVADADEEPAARAVPRAAHDGRPRAAMDPGEHSEEVERLLEVLAGRDPRNWKAAEEALTTRYKRMEMQGYLVNVDEMRRCLDAQLQIFLVGMNALRGQLKMSLLEDIDRAERDSIIDAECDAMLERIAGAANVRRETEATDAA